MVAVERPDSCKPVASTRPPSAAARLDGHKGVADVDVVGAYERMSTPKLAEHRAFVFAHTLVYPFHPRKEAGPQINISSFVLNAEIVYFLLRLLPFYENYVRAIRKLCSTISL